MDKKQILKITKDLPDIIAIAPNAFSRTVPIGFFPNYSIVCFKYRKETDDIAKDVEVFSVEKEKPGIYVEKMNAGEILNIESVKKYIFSKRDPHLLIYKPSPFIETIALDTGWKIIGNAATVKYDIENKLAFRHILDSCGLEKIEGESVLFETLDEKLYKQFVEKYGVKFVFQIAEMTSGGGTGTAFINSPEDFNKFLKKFREKKETLTSIKNVNVTKFVEGVPTSISACATKYGVITGSIQTQILDISQVRSLKEGSGLFCGHDFSFGNFDEKLNLQAKEIAKIFGEYIYKNLNYKGIFGLDLITNVDEGKVYPVECNPRYTDAFPLISQMHVKEGVIPMDVFHIFEHMDVKYNVDVEEISNSYKNIPASQIILESKTEDPTKVTGDVKAGVYQIKDNRYSNNLEVEFIRSGYCFQDLDSDKQFLVTEGVPFKGTVIKGGGRVFRLIFAESILEKPKVLKEKVLDVIDEIYNKISLVKTTPQVFIKDFLGLKICEASSVDELKDLNFQNIDIVNLSDKDVNFGYPRPEKIAWGMALEKDDILSNLKSKKLRKHLKVWLLNMDKYGLSYEIKNELTSKDFELWYEKYFQLLSSKEKANIKINRNWLLYRKKSGKKVSAIFLYKDKKFIGGNLILRNDEKFTVVYGIVEKLQTPNWSMGAIVDFLSIQFAKKLGHKRVGFGQDNNLYGYHLSRGLLQYKLNFGLLPSIKNKTNVYSTKFVNVEKFSDYIIFLGIKGDNNVFYVLSKKGLDKELPKLNTDWEVVYKDISKQ